MNYEERTNAIGRLLRETILRRYDRPSRWDDAVAREQVADMVSDLNAAWPIMNREAFAETGDRLFRQLRKDYDRREWPSIKVLLACLSAALKGDDAPTFEKPAAGWKPDPMQIAAARMNAGEPVAEDWILFGPNAARLAVSGLVPMAIIERYRASHEANLVSVYGPEKGRQMFADACLKDTA